MGPNQTTLVLNPAKEAANTSGKQVSSLVNDVSDESSRDIHEDTMSLLTSFTAWLPQTLVEDIAGYTRASIAYLKGLSFKNWCAYN